MGWTRSLLKDFGDQVLMVVLALLLCVVLVGGFWIADEHHIDLIWVLVSWNSIWLVPLLVKKFRKHPKKPSFVAFLLAWVVIHGLFIVMLTGRVPIVYWPVLILLELTAGFLAANWLFGRVARTQLLASSGSALRTTPDEATLSQVENVV